MAITAAVAASMVVRHGTPAPTAAARMRPSSVRAPLRGRGTRHPRHPRADSLEGHPPGASAFAFAQPSDGYTSTATLLARPASRGLFFQANCRPMYRMVVRELGGPASLRREELDLVPANPGQVVIDVHAVGCNQELLFKISSSDGSAK